MWWYSWLWRWRRREGEALLFCTSVEIAKISKIWLSFENICFKAVNCMALATEGLVTENKLLAATRIFTGYLHVSYFPFHNTWKHFPSNIDFFTARCGSGDCGSPIAVVAGLSSTQGPFARVSAWALKQLPIFWDLVQMWVLLLKAFNMFPMHWNDKGSYHL